MAQPKRFQCNVRLSFATAFRRWRLNSKLPLKRIAKDLGVAVATINAWELGRRFPSARNFEMLVEYSGVPPCKLFCIMADKCVPAECLLAMGREP
jgi:transcriptional regulator with XRE-family HTH domain